MIAKWVREAIEHAGISGAELARRMTERGLAVDRAAVSKMMKETATPRTKPRRVSAAELIAISEITGLPLPAGVTSGKDFLEGRGVLVASYDPDEPDTPPADANEPICGELHPDNHPGVSSDRLYQANMPGASPVLDVRAGAGPGAISLPALNPSGGVIYSEDAVMGEILLPSYLQREMTNAPAGRVHWVRVRGDSMEPTLRGGDHVAVDTTDVSIAQGGLFVARNGDGEIIVKRFFRIPGSDPVQIEIRSDNTTFEPPRIVDADWITIIGRVVAKIGLLG